VQACDYSRTRLTCLSLRKSTANHQENSMARSSILGGSHAPERARGTDTDALGPSNSSDSGSDVQGAREMATEPDNAGEWGALVAEGESDSDSFGTGERGAATGGGRDNGDILPDRIVTPGLGGTSNDALGDVDDMADEDSESLDEAIEGRDEDDDDPI